MTAAVYIVGGTNRTHEELRFSLRSLANCPDITSVWVVGQVPEWVTGVRKIELDPAPEKFANMRQSLTAFANTKGAPKRFYLFNEDHYIVEPIEGEIPTFHLGPAIQYITADHVWRPKNTWCHAVLKTAEWLRDEDGQEPLAYEAHTPLLLDRTKVAAFLDEYPADRPLAMSMVYARAGIGGEGVDAGNAKVGVDSVLADKLAQDMPLLSGNQATFDGELGDLLRGMFPEPCKYERG